MTMETKKNIFREHLPSWLKARKDKKKRSEIIRHIRFITGAHPKSVPRSFKRVQMHDSAQPEKRGRHVVYGADVTSALKDVSEAASHPCGENLHALIPEYVRIFKRDKIWPHSEETTEKLLAMSSATVKRRSERFAHVRKMIRGKSMTKPDNVKSLIPIRNGPWNDAPTGTLQIDTVAHCGGSVAGDFMYTVNTTDVATLWGSRRAQWSKGQEATVESMDRLDEEVPFPILEWHPDTGSEFVNWHCQRWSEKRGQRLTRSRPNRKNDNCFVEERNGHVVRRWVGYARLEEPEVVPALNRFYDVLTPYLNHFIASKRIMAKERVGSKWKITREKKSLTPYERVMARTDVSDEIKAELATEHDGLNPLVLKREVDRRLERVFDIHKRYGKPKLMS